MFKNKESCKHCGSRTRLVDDEFFFNGEQIAYYVCDDCKGFTRIVMKGRK